MRLRSWVVSMTALLMTTTAMADNVYPPRTGGNYGGPRWYGYFGNNNGTDSYVSQNADHTNITQIWALENTQPTRSAQLSAATTDILDSLAAAAQYGEKAMVDVEAFVFITGSPCYSNNSNAAADFQNLVHTLEKNGYLVPNDPELGTVSSFYVVDEPDGKCLGDIPGFAHPVLFNAISAIRQNADTTNFPLATIVTKDRYSTMQIGLGLFDWVGMDDYLYGVSDYLNDFGGFEGSLQHWDVVHGTPQHYFLVPLVTDLNVNGNTSDSDPYYYGASSLYDKFVADNSVIGIMPFAWRVNKAIGMAGTWWANSYISLGKSIVSSNPQVILPADIVVTVDNGLLLL